MNVKKQLKPEAEQFVASHLATAGLLRFMIPSRFTYLNHTANGTSRVALFQPLCVSTSLI